MAKDNVDNMLIRFLNWMLSACGYVIAFLLVAWAIKFLFFKVF